MANLSQAVETQLKNIEAKTGKTRDELRSLILQSGLAKHGEIRTLMMNSLGLGYGDANALVHFALQSDGERAATAEGLNLNELVDALYSGGKASLRPIHDRLMAAIQGFGPFETLPKKGYLSLRGKKQFAMLGPATNSRVELGLNGRDLGDDPRLEAQPAGSMCHYVVKITAAEQVDEDLIQIIQRAYEQTRPD